MFGLPSNFWWKWRNRKMLREMREIRLRRENAIAVVLIAQRRFDAVLRSCGERGGSPMRDAAVRQAYDDYRRVRDIFDAYGPCDIEALMAVS